MKNVEESEISTLLARLSTLEAVINGPASSSFNNLQSEIKDCGNQLTAIEDSIPDLIPCRNLLITVTPIVTMHRSRINAIVEKAAELLFNEKSILQTINEVQQVQKLSSHLSTERIEGLFQLHVSL